MNHASPFSKDWKKSKIADTNAPIEKFKTIKPVLSKGAVRKLLDCEFEVDAGMIFWTERWLDQVIREKSLPPQIALRDPMGQLTHFLGTDALKIFENIRADFKSSFPSLHPKDDYSFLDGIPFLEG